MLLQMHLTSRTAFELANTNSYEPRRPVPLQALLVACTYYRRGWCRLRPMSCGRIAMVDRVGGASPHWKSERTIHARIVT